MPQKKDGKTGERKKSMSYERIQPYGRTMFIGANPLSRRKFAGEHCSPIHLNVCEILGDKKHPKIKSGAWISMSALLYRLYGFAEEHARVRHVV
jgi:hypothetical protein